MFASRSRFLPLRQNMGAKVRQKPLTAKYDVRKSGINFGGLHNYS